MTLCRAGLPTPGPSRPHPHSSWISRIKRHSMCGQAEGAASSGAGWRERRASTPLPPHPVTPLSAHQTQCRLRTETARPQELEHRVQEPQGVHSPGPYLGRERQRQPPPPGQVPTPTGSLESHPPLPEHCPLNHSSGGSTAEGRGGVCGSRQGAAVGVPAGQGRNPSSVPAGCVIWGSNLTSLGHCSCL